MAVPVFYQIACARFHLASTRQYSMVDGRTNVLFCKPSGFYKTSKELNELNSKLFFV